MRCIVCALLLTLLAVGGCSTCASPHDRAYAAYGGLWERTDECEGRVGSAFTASGIRISDEATDYGLETTDYGLETTDYGLEATDYGLEATEGPQAAEDSPQAIDDGLQVIED